MTEIKAHRAPPLSHPKGKSFYVTVDGQAIGNSDNMFFATKIAAVLAGQKYVAMKGGKS